MDAQLLHALTERTFSVSEYTELLNTLVAPLSVTVEGEVSGLRILPQWVFFDLKDTEEGGVLRCGMHRSGYRALGVALDDGMQVAVSGAGKINGKSGNFGFWVRDIVPTGEGALRRIYELLLAQLENEGLFRQTRPLPLVIQHVALITSLSGVVIEDFRTNLTPHGIAVSVVHSSVEGKDAAPEIVRALERVRVLSPDVVVVIRGGGSLESLQAFNTEDVARALFASPVPTIVGIGHDVDVPIACKVADVSVSTPTAAAHVINDTWHVIEARFDTAWRTALDTQQSYLAETARRTDVARLRTQHGIERIRSLGKMYTAQVHEWAARMVRVCRLYTEHITTHKDVLYRQLEHMLTTTGRRVAVAQLHAHHGMERMRTLGNVYTKQVHEWTTHMTRVCQSQRERTLVSEDVLNRQFRQTLATHENMRASAVRIIAAHDPRAALKRGYAIARTNTGAVVRSVHDITTGDTLSLIVQDGTIETTVV
jgi:exodeoxyribonuclease VII large subunit